MIRSVLIIGSGPIVIGQAAEFDYSGTQACLACREAGVRTVLVNANPATIQTDPDTADVVYIEPLTVDAVEQIIARERPDGLIATVGGQTALNLALALDEAGVLARYRVRLLGTDLDVIRRGEDRALFAEAVRAAGEPVLPSVAVSTVDDALCAAAALGYPVMCRAAFALGGAGSGIVRDRNELVRQVQLALGSSAALADGRPQVLIEKSVDGWTEVEYEVIRDAADNCLVVCNMENIDPMGVHTGDSIVVAPSQTLTDAEYHTLRASAIAVVRALGVVGACNIQFALQRHDGTEAEPRNASIERDPLTPSPYHYYVIEVNPRLSRSSALASKATGYPIAKVATRIALGRTLPEIRNDITGTSAFFEPALDYITVKIPRWPYDKFSRLNPVIGTRMRSTGEVMAIGRTFEEAMRKALRSLDIDVQRSTFNIQRPGDKRDELLAHPNAWRLPAILRALWDGRPADDVSPVTRIHPWFIDKLAHVATTAPGTWRNPPSTEYSERRTQNAERRTDPSELRTQNSQLPTTYKMVDTCAGEFEAHTPYFYATDAAAGPSEAPPLAGPKAIILGSGPIRIGQGIEFDYSSVRACQALRAAGVKPIIINNNPETVSTDYATSDRLYFEPLDADAVLHVVANEREGLLGVLPQFGGQTAINLVHTLQEHGIPILGTPADAIDAAEDRRRATALLADAGIPAPRWRSVDRWEDVPAAVPMVGYPALLRPSYVLSGRGMVIVRSAAEVQRYLAVHGHTPLAKPLLIDQFLDGAIELDVDAVSDGTDTVAIVMEQLEECGVHSGDSVEVYPVQSVSEAALATVAEYTRRLARAFGIVGLMNVQYAVRGDDVFVLEVNPRASRSVPFATKASGVPLTDLAVRVILGARLNELSIPPPRADRVCVKEVVLPFRVFPDLDPVLGPEMQSTGEAMGIGPTFGTAYWKAMLGAGATRLPFGRPVYLSAAPDVAGLETLVERLHAVGCQVLAPPNLAPRLRSSTACEAEDVNPAGLGLAIVLERSSADLALLRQAVASGCPYISTPGHVRGLALALAEGFPILTAEPLSRSVSGQRSEAA